MIRISDLRSRLFDRGSGRSTGRSTHIQDHVLFLHSFTSSLSSLLHRLSNTMLLPTMRHTVKNNIATIELVLSPGIQPADFTLDTRSWSELGERTTISLVGIVGVLRARTQDPLSVQKIIQLAKSPKVLLQEWQHVKARIAFQMAKNNERDRQECARGDREAGTGQAWHLFLGRVSSEGLRY